MAKITFTVCFTLLVVSALGDDPAAQAGPVKVPNDGSCTWRGGDYGDVTQCLSDEVAIGSCGSGKDPDCENPDSGDDEYDMILCCPINNYSFTSCETKYAEYGEDLSCVDSTPQASIVEAICGSGRDDDCDGYSHMITCCEGRIRTGTNFNDFERLYAAGGCSWSYADYGDSLTCSSDTQAIFGRCGSGRDPDCNDGDDYHGIQCCNLVSF